MSSIATQSIGRRIVWLVVGVSVLALVLHGVLLVSAISPLADELARQAATTINVSRRVLQEASVDERDAVVAWLGQAGVDARPGDFDRETRTAEGGSVPLGNPMLARLRSHLEPGIDALQPSRDASNGIALRFVTSIDDGPWRLALPAIPPPAANPVVPLLTTLLLIGSAAALALILGARWITGPMSRLSQALLDRREALAPIPDPPGAAVEVKGVIDAFNVLVEALQSTQAAQRNMLAGLSHDLRTPLARLRLRAELECPEPVQQRMNIDFDALSRIIDQFLLYSREQAGMPDDSVVASPLGVAREIVDAYRDGGVDISLSAASASISPVPDLPDLAIRRVIDNLVDNARTHGRAPIEVAFRRRHGVLRLMVYDRGRGFDASALAEATAPFTRLGHSSRGVGHCGLGLAIVAQIASRLGGEVVIAPFDGVRFGIGIELPSVQPGSDAR